MKSNNFTPLKYKQYPSRLKKMTRWQVIRLKEMDYKNIYISKILGIHSSTISSWYKNYLKSSPSSNFDLEATLVAKFGKLLPEEINVISYQAIQLVDSGIKRSKVAEILGLSSGAVVSGWLNEYRQIEQKKTPAKKTCKISISRKKTKKQKVNRKPYKSFTKRMRDIIHWQALRLKQKGYEISYISGVLNINNSLISKYCKSYKKEPVNTNSLRTETVLKKFGHLSVKEKEMLLSQVTYLANDGVQRSDIAKIIGLSSGAVISGWYQEKLIISLKKTTKDNTSLHGAIYKKLSLLNYRSYKPETKKLVQWQALYLINKGYKYSEASTILHIHASTISKWWKSHQKSEDNKKIKLNGELTQQFKKLTPEMNNVLSLQIITLKDLGYPHKKIAYILALKNAALITRWLKRISLSTNSNSIATVKADTLNIPQIGLIKKNKEISTPKITNHINSQKKQSFEKPKEISNSLIQTNNKRNDSYSTYFSNEGNSIVLKTETKIIKAKDYAHYFEARKLIEVSKDRIIQSEKKALEIKVEAEKSAKQMTCKIIKTAKKKARKEADELLAEKNIAAANSVTKYLSSLQENLPDIIMAIIGKFIKNYDDKDFIIHTINSAISEINNEEKVKIHVNRKVIASVKERLNDIDFPNEKIALISDDTLRKKDCLVVTKLGTVNTNLESQIKKIEENIRATNAL